MIVAEYFVHSVSSRFIHKRKFLTDSFLFDLDSLFFQSASHRQKLQEDSNHGVWAKSFVFVKWRKFWEKIFEKYRSSELFLRGVSRIQGLFHVEYNNESRKSGSNICIFRFKIFWRLRPLVLKSVLQTPLSAPILYYSLEIFSHCSNADL